MRCKVSWMARKNLHVANTPPVISPINPEALKCSETAAKPHQRPKTEYACRQLRLPSLTVLILESLLCQLSASSTVDLHCRPPHATTKSPSERRISASVRRQGPKLQKGRGPPTKSRCPCFHGTNPLCKCGRSHRIAPETRQLIAHDMVAGE